MLELLTNAEMSEADRCTIASGVSGATLMENAGTVVADAIMARHPPGSRVAVVAGTGNNGGDGFVAARHLHHAGYRVTVHLIGRRDAIRGDAAAAAEQWQGRTATGASDLAGAHVIVDALFGAGLDRPLAGDALAAVMAMNGAGAPVIAVDLQIGIPDDVLAIIRPATCENGPTLWGDKFPVPTAQGHKYSRGHAAVVSGGRAHTGAARLAALAALRGGAGLVTLATPRDALDINAAANLAVMVRPIDAATEFEAMLSDSRFNAAAIGPGAGVGPHTREMTLAALAGPRSVVIDADALTSFADHPDLLFVALNKSRRAVLTPHSGEFHRLFDKSLKSSPAAFASKLSATRAAAGIAGAVVLHKGADTVIAAPDGRAAINANAPPWLATAGTGDVLAGLITGLLAQGMPGFEAAAAAVWIHGEAAAAAGPGMISEDLAPRFGEVYRRLFTLGTFGAGM